MFNRVVGVIRMSSIHSTCRELFTDGLIYGVSCLHVSCFQRSDTIRNSNSSWSPFRDRRLLHITNLFLHKFLRNRSNVFKLGKKKKSLRLNYFRRPQKIRKIKKKRKFTMNSLQNPIASKLIATLKVENIFFPMFRVCMT